MFVGLALLFNMPFILTQLTQWISVPRQNAVEYVVQLAANLLVVWVNVPASGLGLAQLIDQPHFRRASTEFGVVPTTPLAWALLLVFWVLAAALFALLISVVRTKFPKLFADNGSNYD
jgi:hypothetical protein